VITTVVLAAGESKRFPDHSTPKPFIKFRVPPARNPSQMWENAINNLTIPTDVYLALRTDHYQYSIEATSRHDIRALWLDPTPGQAATLEAVIQAFIQRGLNIEELLVVNCDQGFAPGILDRLVQRGREGGVTCALTFQAPPQEHYRWSYVDGHPQFNEAAEKRVVGTHGLAGAYYFPNLHRLYKAVRLATAQAEELDEEPYISQIFQHIPFLKFSLEIRREDWYDWGTSQALKKFLGEK